MPKSDVQFMADMTRHVSIALVALAAAALAAQTPKGWRMRVDESAAASDPATARIGFTATDTGFHAGNPDGAVYWNPADIANGDFTLKAAFTLMKPAPSPNFYGLVFAARDLEGPRRQYLYFMVAQDGTWLIKRRNADASEDYIVPKTASAAVQKPDAAGKSVNVLEVRARAGTVEYLVNGARVHSAPADAAGLCGVRITRLLDIRVDGFRLSK
jgi:hypothetical protein